MGAKKLPEKQLTLKAYAHTSLGRIIEYLQALPQDERELAKQTLEARFLPFCLEPGDSQAKAIAIQCAEACESFARSIRAIYGLAQPSIVPAAPALDAHTLQSDKTAVERVASNRPPALDSPQTSALKQHRAQTESMFH